jgi:hypothetical protein
MKSRTNMWLIGAYSMFGLAFFSNENIYTNIQTVFLVAVSTIAIHFVAAKTAFRNGFNVGADFTKRYIFNVLGEDMQKLVDRKMSEDLNKIGE